MAVAFRAAASNDADATSVSVTVPTSGSGGTVAVDDLAYLVWAGYEVGNVGGLATPSGWTEMAAPQAWNSNTSCYALCRKVLEVGDLGASLSFGTMSVGARLQNIAVIIYSAASHDSASSLTFDVTPETTITLPGIDPTAVDCMLLSISSMQQDIGNPAAVTVTPTSGWTERLEAATAEASGENGTIFAQEKQETGGGPFGSVAATATANVDDAAITIAMAPEAGAEQSFIHPLLFPGLPRR